MMIASIVTTHISAGLSLISSMSSTVSAIHSQTFREVCYVLSEIRQFLFQPLANKKQPSVDNENRAKGHASRTCIRESNKSPKHLAPQKYPIKQLF